MTRQRTGFQQTHYQRGPVIRVRSEYDAVIYLSFWDGRGKEKALGADPLPLINYQVEPSSP